ncbi:MAG TPA: PQQ-dependent sugar dehydrogenase [Gammaproteobacteria bacterium]|nr:PQQ-dependent sugar dehydrogenase [Gammaproteobacteria bacterium]
MTKPSAVKIVRVAALSKTLAVAAAVGLGAIAPHGAAAQEAAPKGAGSSLAAPTLPPAFHATLFAEGLPTPRHVAIRDNGDVYVTLRSGHAKFRETNEPGGIQALGDTNGDGVADASTRFGSPDIDTALSIHDGSLYFSSTTTIYAVRLDENLVPKAAPEIVVADMPESCCGHRTKPIAFDAAGHLYTQVGSPSNACQTEPDKPGSPGMRPCTLLDEHGGVFRFDAAARNQVHARDGKRYSRGHRNVVALAWNAEAGALFALMHGRDGLHALWPEHYTAEDDLALPAEEFHRIEEGDDLGWPYTYFDPRRMERMVMPEYGGDGKTPAEPGRYKTPLIAFPAHWAPDDLLFYTGTQFPERYRHGAFIAFHGPVAPQPDDVAGYCVVFVPMNAAGEVTGPWEIFADDFERVRAASGAPARPSGLGVGPDGALYVVDDTGGRIWKVAYDADRPR